MAILMKKLVSAFLSASMILALFAVPVVSADGFDCWEKVFSGGVVATAEIDKEVYYSGDASLKITRETVKKSNVYIAVKTAVTFEEGKKYSVSLMAKADKANDFTLLVGWDKRYSLTPLANTYQWTRFEFDYVSPKTETLDIMIIVDGVTKAAWIDNVEVIDTETGENLIKNSTFDSAAVEEQKEPVQEEHFDDSLAGIYNKIMSSEYFTEEELIKVRGAFKYMPVYKALEITIDGDGSDWTDFPDMAMPVFSDQFQVYMNDGRAKDVSAISKFAYDDENFYVFLEVTDDIFYSLSGENDYWKGDSIQLTISSTDESYGSELGFSRNMTTGEGEVYGSGFTGAQKNKVTLKTSQGGNKTIYEAKIPWDIKFTSRPDALYFDYIVNDNDGDGRRYCLELAPGIAEGKTNAQFPYLRVMNDKSSWYSWVQGKRTGLNNENVDVSYFIVNNGDEKNFEVYNSLTKETEKITVPAQSCFRKSINYVFDTWGNCKCTIEVKSGGDIEVSSMNIDVKLGVASREEAEQLVKTLESQALELKNLMEECDKKGIQYDYELLNYKIIDRFAAFIQDDIDNDDFTRIYYTAETTNALYKESKANLEGYLCGEKEPKIVPHYKTGEVKYDGIGAIATFEVNGVEEQRPAFFHGYLDFGRMGDTFKDFSEFGHNAYADEVGPTMVMASASPWEKFILAKPEYMLETTGEDVKFGEKALKITYNSEKIANRGVGVVQYINVVPGKTYELRGWIKAGNAEYVAVSANDWDDRLMLSGNYDWKEFSTKYTAPKGKTSTGVRLMIDAKADYIYFDDLEFVEEGTEKNLLKDGGFEQYGEDGIYHFNYDAPMITELYGIFEEAEKNNIAISFLVSPHYFPKVLINDANIPMTGEGFLNYNVNAPEAREYIEKYLRGIIPLIKDYKSLSNIVISNEPQFQVKECGDYYLTDWQNYLKDKYVDIENLNEAYQWKYSSFDEIDFDSVSTVKDFDYKLFNDMVFTEWHQWMADIIREIAPDIPLSYKIMGNVGKSSITNLKNGTNYEMQHKIFDINGCDYWRLIETDEKNPLSKFLWYDYQTSLKYAPIVNSEDHIIMDRSEYYGHDVAGWVGQDIYQGGIHGRFMSTMWYWERTYDKKGDAWGSVLNRPDALSQIGTAGFDLNRLAYEITAIQKEPSEVGILHSPASVLAKPLTTEAIYEAYAGVLYNGQKVRFIVESQAENMHECKLMIIPNATRVTSGTVAEIRKYIENGGKVLIMGEDSLRLNHEGLQNNSKDVEFIISNSELVPYTGFLSDAPEELHSKIRNMMKELGIYYISVIDEATGKPAENIETNIGVYDGKVIINLANYGDERVVRIYAGDTLMNGAVELRSGDELGSSISIGHYQSITLETDIDNVFFDTYGHWAEKDITTLSNEGIISGISDSRFAPDRQITRAEFLALLVRAAGIDKPSYNGGIDDVFAEDWYADDVAAAIENGVIGSDNFRPDDIITRDEMCGLLVKFYEVKNGSITRCEMSFTDVELINDKEIVSKAVSAGLIFGRDDGRFDPQSGMTRAEAAAVITRFLK